MQQVIAHPEALKCGLGHIGRRFRNAARRCISARCGQNDMVNRRACAVEVLDVFGDCCIGDDKRGALAKRGNCRCQLVSIAAGSSLPEGGTTSAL
jgi:hypothetical protein